MLVNANASFGGILLCTTSALNYSVGFDCSWRGRGRTTGDVKSSICKSDIMHRRGCFHITRLLIALH